MKHIVTLLLGAFICLLGMPSACAQQDTDSLVAALVALPDDTVKIERLGMNGARLRGNSPAQSLQLIEEALRVATALNKPYYIGMCYNELGLTYKDQARAAKSEEAYMQALAAFAEAKSERGTAKVFNNLGNLWNAQGQQERALDYYLRSLEIKERLGIKENLSIPIGNIGLIFMEIGNYEKSLEYYKRALALNEANSDSNKIAISYHNLGKVYFNLQDYSQAIGYFLKEIQIARLHQDKRSLMGAYQSVADAYSLKKEYEKAQEYLLKAHALALSLNLPGNLVDIINQQSRTYMEAGKTTAAIVDTLEQNFRQAVALGLKGEQFEALKMLSEGCHKLHHGRKARQYEEQAKALEAELTGPGKAIHLHQMEQDFKDRKGQRSN